MQKHVLRQAPARTGLAGPGGLLLSSSFHHTSFKVQERNNKGWVQLHDFRPSLVSQKNEVRLDNVVSPVLAPGYEIAEALAVPASHESVAAS